MRVAVIGAGIVGVTSAYELQLAGHEVTVFERRGAAAAETSFANAGVIAPGYVTPWAAPGMPRKVLAQWFERDAAVRLGALPDLATLRWLWRWWRACNARDYARHRRALYELARESQARLRAIGAELNAQYEQTRGLLVLLRGAPELRLSRSGLALLAEIGVDFHLLDPDACRRIEPALDASVELKAGVHLPDSDVGNCRQFALLLKSEAQRRGVEFRFLHAVRGIESGTPLCVRVQAQSEGDTGSSLDEPSGALQQHDFDAVVVCAGVAARALLAPLGVRLPLIAVHGYSITLPVRHHEAHPDMAPRAALMDERYKVAISRLGDRVRVAGSAELGGALDSMNDKALATLYRVLEDWFPSGVKRGQAQAWKGARPMLPDGPPRIGASGVPGLWLNVGHGSSGWALACGSAQRLAAMIGSHA
jgi:D-amino-acid dehydrogenase